MMTTFIKLNSVPTAKQMKASATGALKTRYNACETLCKAIKSHVAGPSPMKAIRRWTNDKDPR